MSLLEDTGDIVATPENLSALAELAKTQKRLERNVELAQDNLKKAQQELRRVQEKEIPDLMMECGVETFVTTDGLKISVKENLYASIAKSRKIEAAQWLIQNGQGSLVQEDVVVHFDSGEQERVSRLQETLESAGFSDWSTMEAMNTARVKSAIKEMLSDGVDVPLDLFGAYFLRSAKITEV